MLSVVTYVHSWQLAISIKQYCGQWSKLDLLYWSTYFPLDQDDGEKMMIESIRIIDFVTMGIPIDLSNNKW